MNKNREFAMNGGWGLDINRTQPLQVGYKVILSLEEYWMSAGYELQTIKIPIDEFRSTHILSLRVDNQSLNCVVSCVSRYHKIQSSSYNIVFTQGDSGGPLWQYSNGRAVLIEVISRTQLAHNWTHYDKCDGSLNSNGALL